MDPWTPRPSGQLRNWWDSAITIALCSALSAVISTLIASSYSKAASDRMADVKLVELAVGLLRETPQAETEGVREWAVRILNMHSGVPLERGIQESLTNCVTFPQVAVPGVPVADLKINGCDSNVTVTDEGFTYSWSSSQATACQLSVYDSTGTLIGQSGSTLSGASSRVPANHPWYPAPGQAATLTFSCTDGTRSVSDSVVIQRPS